MAGIDFEKFFGKAWEVTKTVLGTMVVQEGQKIPEVRKQIAAAKISAGKSALWSSFPFILVGVLAVVLIKKF